MLTADKFAVFKIDLNKVDLESFVLCMLVQKHLDQNDLVFFDFSVDKQEVTS